MHPIFIQTFYYMVVIVIAFLILSFVQKGFFWKYLRVKSSFGKYTLIKIRAVNRDHFSVGEVEEGFMCFKLRGKWLRISIPPDKPIFYRSIGVSWADYDEEKNSFGSTDYTGVPGFNAEKYTNLYLRTLYAPTINDNKDKIILITCFLIVLILGFMWFFIYKHDQLLKSVIPMIKQATTSTIVPTGA